MSLPKPVVPFAQMGCWIVGSAADPFNHKPRDWDLMVPFHRWNEVAPMIPKDAIPNTFGGWKFTVDDVEIDIWPEDLSDWLTKLGLVKWVYHPLSGARFTRYEA